MADREIIDSGSLSVAASGVEYGSWISTDDVSVLVVIAKSSVANQADVRVEESNDASTVLFQDWADISHDGTTYKFSVQPGASFVRFRAASVGSAITVNYVMRSTPR